MNPAGTHPKTSTGPEIRLPRALVTLDPATVPTEHVDVLVVGSGVAGLSVALDLAGQHTVLLATKGRLSHGATRYAQGGIAAVLGAPDRAEDHWADTMAAGAGLCDPEAVAALVAEGDEAIARLQQAGARFDLDPEGRLARTREGGHRRARIVHAGGDATGAEVERALVNATRAAHGVHVTEQTFLVDLLTATDGMVCGAVLALSGQAGGVRLQVVTASAVVLATGGAGQLFSATTNPSQSTGDGIAAALRAGAQVADMEFAQFHPTVLHVARDPRPLMSEALRGEGATIVDQRGQTVMDGIHPLGDLAPRDVVTRAMATRMRELGTDHLLLDATGLGGPEALRHRFPTITAACRAAGIDPARQPIPVSPAMHYLMGGVRADLEGRTTVPGLYAVGEAACTGVHGANRLASNSLLEGVVFAGRVARDLVGTLPRRGRPTRLRAPEPVPRVSGSSRRRSNERTWLRQLMSDQVGVLRDAHGLGQAQTELAEFTRRPGGPPGTAHSTEPWETTNLAQIGLVIAVLAGLRTESRGAHWRRDAPVPDPSWEIRQISARTDQGDLQRGIILADSTDHETVPTH